MELPTSGGHPVKPEPQQQAAVHLLEMSAFYPLCTVTIDELLPRKGPGNYALGYSVGDTFRVFYVGRSDVDLAQRLHEWVGMPSLVKRYCAASQASWTTRRRGWRQAGTPALGSVGCVDSPYTHFACSYARSAEEAYAKEWRTYDAFGGHCNLDNERQPSP